MSRYHSYLNSAKEILSAYKGEQPFGFFLKDFFARYKKYGSKDRKQISHLCYCYFRLGKAAMGLPVEERILMGLFLCSNESNEIPKGKCGLIGMIRLEKPERKMFSQSPADNAQCSSR